VFLGVKVHAVFVSPFGRFGRASSLGFPGRAWEPVKEQKNCMSQKRVNSIKVNRLRRGRRLSIIGFLQPLISFVYGLVIGGVNRWSYINMMEREAQEAQKLGRMRVIVQDNGPIHRC
jgi:hypothetical protein